MSEAYNKRACRFGGDFIRVCWRCGVRPTRTKPIVVEILEKGYGLSPEAIK